MKFFRTLSIFLLAGVLVSCSDDDEIVIILGNMNIQLELETGLSDIPLNDIDLQATNSTDNSEYSATTDANGLAIFENLPLGNYDITVIEATDNYTISGSATEISLLDSEIVTETITLSATNPNATLVIKEVYSTGGSSAVLIRDQFIEIFNNSSEVIHADGMYLANLFTPSSDNSVGDGLSGEDATNNVYARDVVQFPGSGQDYPIQPSSSIVVAFNASDFTSDLLSTGINNTDATLEIYSVEWLEANGGSGNTSFDSNNPDVENMTNIYIMQQISGFYSISPSRPSIALVSADASVSNSDVVIYTNPDIASQTFPLVRIPVTQVVDGFETLESDDLADYKVIPDDVDAGFAVISPDGSNPAFSGKSVIRKVDEVATARFGRTILLDTNNSTVDFESIDAPDKYGYNN
ncbi:MAG: DUF4876 domain-containing protein [Bacteroidota bacterium]